MKSSKDSYAYLTHSDKICPIFNNISVYDDTRSREIALGISSNGNARLCKIPLYISSNGDVRLTERSWEINLISLKGHNGVEIKMFKTINYH